jgi:Lipocalin-like domain
MIRRAAILLWTHWLLGFALIVSPAHAQQTSLRERLVGTWTYVSSTAKLPDGSPLWGHEPKSLFILTDNSRFSWQVFRSDRPKFASNNRLEATVDELRSNNRGSLAYFGTYTVNETDKTITFRTEAGTYPNAEGEVIMRVITKLTADEWIYINPATTLGTRIEAVWRRIN